jgi:hypothetical protein
MVEFMGRRYRVTQDPRLDFVEFMGKSYRVI